jgi:hypothetical protein
MRTTSLLVLGVFALMSSAHAATIQFDLMGTAGAGLLPGNEPSLTVPSTGSGGEFGAGITFDDVSLVLTVNVAWGSVKGFTDLTSNANNSHIHGPVSVAQASTFTGTAGIPSGFNLARASSLANDGLISTTVTFTSTQAAELMQGRYYINIHTTSNTGGEMRGFLRPVPEPGLIGLLAAGAGALAARRRR